MENNKLPLSVALISFNEESNIERTLRSIYKIASEIVLVDSNSKDKTVEIAKSYGAKVYVEEWKGFINQKNSALSKCTQPWILALDCDEVPNPELLASISEVIQIGKKFGYLIQRRTFYLGKLLKRSWQPDWKLRLVHKDCHPRWEGIEPHDELKVNAPLKKLRGFAIHYSYKNISQHFQKTIKYSYLTAKTYFDNGKRANFFKFVFNPIFAFLKLYIINFGLLDGVRGFIVAVSAFISTFLKYAFLWERSKIFTNNDDQHIS